MRKTILIDDLDETADGTVTTIPYTLGGTNYEIDLTPAHAEELHRILVELGRFTAASRAIPSGNGTRTRTASYDAATVRVWAQANGIEVSEKGRVPMDVVDQWRQQLAAAGSGTAPAVTTGTAGA